MGIRVGMAAYHARTPMTPGERPPVSLEGYEQLLGDVRQILATAHDRAYQAIDNLRVQAYWQVGERIVSEELRQGGRADYGERILVRLAADLGFGRSDRYRMLRFYRAYSVVTALDQCLSWMLYTVLIDVTDPGARRFYEASAVREAWSVRELRADPGRPLCAASPRRALPPSRPDTTGPLASSKRLLLPTHPQHGRIPPSVRTIHRCAPPSTIIVWQPFQWERTAALGGECGLRA